MIYAKIILAVILSALPFVVSHYLKTAKKESSTYKSLFAFIGTHLPLLYNLLKAFRNFFQKVYTAMKRSDNARKFFVLVTLLVMIVFQFIDFTASSTIANMATGYKNNSLEMDKIFTIYAPLMTRPQASLIAACMSFSFFSYRLGNLILTELHNDENAYFVTAVIALVFLLYSTRFIIVSEILLIILFAAWIFPNKTNCKQPQNTLHIQNVLKNQTKMSPAA